MKLRFFLENIKLELDLPQSDLKPPYPVATHHHPIYIIIGPDEWFQGKKVRIPIYPVHKHQEQSRYELNMKLYDPIDKDYLLYRDQGEKVYVGTYMASIECCLMVPVQQSTICVPGRYAKITVVTLADLHFGKRKFHIKAHSKFDEKDVLCSFDFIIDQVDGIPHDLFPLNFKRVEWFHGERKKMYERSEKLAKEFAESAFQTRKWYEYEFDGDDNIYVTSCPNILGRRPLNTFLYMRPQKMNEAYLKSLFQLAVCFRKTELGIPFETILDEVESVDDEEQTKRLWKQYDKKEKLSLTGEMIGLIPIHVPYLDDAILHQNGRIEISDRTDDHSTTYCEGGDDCDGLAGCCNHVTTAIIRSGPYQCLYLEEMRKLLLNYTTCLNVSMINESHTKIVEDPHYAFLLHRKKWILDHVHVPSEFEGASHFNEEIEKLRQIEKRLGTMEEDPELPDSIIVEGTTWLYSYPIEKRSPTPSRSTQLPTIKRWQPKGTHELKHRMLQNQRDPTITKYFSMTTNYFIDHPVHPINIPVLTYSTRKGCGTLTKTRGIRINDLFACTKGVTPVIIPEGWFKDFKRAKWEMEMISRDKYGLIPLCKNPDGTLESKVDSKFLPVQLPHVISKEKLEYLKGRGLYRKCPSVTDLVNSFCSTISSSLIGQFLENTNKEDLTGIYYFELYETNTNFIVWLRSK